MGDERRPAKSPPIGDPEHRHKGADKVPVALDDDVMVRVGDGSRMASRIAPPRGSEALRFMTKPYAS